MNEETKKLKWKIALVFIASFAMLFVIFINIILAIDFIQERGLPNSFTETRSLLADLVDSPGALRTTPELVFKPGDALAASALVERLPISADQICISTGQFEQDIENGFECVGCEDAGDIQKLIYHGKTNMAAKIAVACDIGLSEIKEDIAAYGLEYVEGTSINAACNVCEGKVKCCAIVLKHS